MTRPWRHLWTTPGGTQAFIRDNEDGTFDVFSTQENDPFLERNKALANAGDGFSPSRDLRREGSIPMALIEKWKQEEGVNVLHPSGHEFLKRKLNDYDYSYLRTSPGKT
jgi:hypothetical protein